MITWEEKWARKIAEMATKNKEQARETAKGQILKISGFFIVFLNVMLAFLVPLLLLKILPSPISFLGPLYLGYTTIAARSLEVEALKVKKALGESVEAARKQVAHIVGRETALLRPREIMKATVETVAENTADGVIAPLFFMMIFGVPGAMAYKMINTMDSMLGYMDEDYRALGFFPAKMDDIINYIPARLTAFCMLLSTYFSKKYDKETKKRAREIYTRDHKKHKSPNGGHPESMVAGLLGISLGGDNWYHGILVKKPTIGDIIKQVDISMIDQSISIMYQTEVFLVMVYYILYFLLCWIRR